MSEFGNETATATMKLGGKSIELLMKLLKFLIERNERKIDRDIKAEQARQLKSNRNKENAVGYLNKKRGYVRAKHLYNSGEKLMPIATAMSPEELSRFNKLAKLEGVSFSAIADQRVIEEIKAVKKELHEIEKTEKSVGLTEEQLTRRNELQKKLDSLNEKRQDRIIIIRAKDIELVKEITDRMNTEIQFNDIDKELSDLRDKGTENLSEEEKARIEDLLKEKEYMMKKEFDAFNDKNNDVIYQSSIDNPKWEEMSFEKAVNKVTDRKYAQEPCYICERTNPNNYMEVTSIPQEHNGKTFTNTEFKVFNNGVEQQCEEFSHGKFTHYSRKDGENSSSYGDDHWKNMKTEMKEKGGFSDDTLIFNSKEDYLKYKETFKEMQKEIAPKENTIAYEADKESYKDYMGIVYKLQEQLSDRKLAINEQKEISDMTDDEKIFNAETINIEKQIDTYQQLNDCQTQLAFIRHQQEINESSFEKQGKPSSIENMYEQARENLHKQAYDTNMKIASLESKAHGLQLEREQLSSIKIVNVIQGQHIENELLINQERQNDSNNKNLENETEVEKSVTRDEEKYTQSKEQWSRDVQKPNDVQAVSSNTEKVNIKIAEAEKE